MTFDEFLVSKETIGEFDRDFVTKVKYNDNIDYIFKTNYGGLNYNSELKCVGLFDKKNNKLYGSSYDFNGMFNKEMYSNFYVGSIESIKNNLYKNADKLLNNYINDNSKTLRNMAKETFDKYISYEGNYNSIKEQAVKNYIYNFDKKELKFHVNTSKYERNNDVNKITMEEIEFPEETEYRVFEEYINNEEKTEHIYSRETNNIELTAKERIGARLLEKDLEGDSEYKKKVPLSDYSDYEKYIDRMVKGEKNVLVSEDIEYFGHTSGTTGKQKLVPVTRSSRVAASKYMALLSQRFAYNYFKDSWSYGKGLMIADIVTTTYTDGGIPICSATSGGMKSIKNVIPYMYSSPYEVMLIKDKEAALYLHLLFALIEEKLSYISGVFVSNILDLLRILDNKKNLLVRDIRRGRIDRNLNIDDNFRKKLNSFIKPDAARADYLEKEFSKGFQGICKRIWPNLLYIACVTGANFSVYDEKVNYYTENLPIYSPAYAATEGTIGINPFVSEIKYVIIPDTVFYEFILVDNKNYKKIETYTLEQLKIGKAYEVVVTSYAGLYRYRIGDVIKVVGFYNKSPEIVFLYRKNQVLNMVAEKTTEEHLKNSIDNTMKSLKLSLVDYTTLEDNSVSPGRYVFYLELENDISKNTIKDIEKVLCIDDLAKGDDLFFAATGITEGDLLQGVRHTAHNKATTQSVVMRGKTGTIRFVDAIHNLDKNDILVDLMKKYNMD